MCLQAMSSVSLPTTDHHWKWALPGSHDPFKNFTPLKFPGMAEDIIVKFARLGPRSISLLMTNCPPSGRGQDHVTS